MSTPDDKTEAAKTKPPAKTIGQLTSGARIQAIVPSTVNETIRLAEIISASGLAPKDLDTAEKVMIVLMKGLEVGLPPMTSLESFGVINGKACLYGDGIPTLLWSNGFKIKEWYTGRETSLLETVAHCKITRPDGDEYEFSYSTKDAIENKLYDPKATSNHPWQRYTVRMLKMRCRGWLARDVASDVLKGVPLYEEQRDMIDVTPEQIPVLDLPDEITLAEPVSDAESSQDPMIENPEQYLSHLAESLSGSAVDGRDAFDEAWTAHLDDCDGRLSREYQEKAKAIHDKVKAKHFPEPEKPAPKEKKKGSKGSKSGGGTPSLI